MKRFRLSVFAVFMGMIHSFLLFPVQIFDQSSLSGSSEKSASFSNILREIGDKYDVYFTMEIGLISGDVANSLEKKNVATKPQKKSVRQELEELRKTIPNLTYKYDKDNSKIIHIIDARLTQQQSYALEKTVKDISFDGMLFDFVNAIGQKGIAVSSSGMIDTYEALAVDIGTMVTIKEKDKSVRYLLTNCLSVKGRPRVLWIARTEIRDHPTSYVRFLR